MLSVPQSAVNNAASTAVAASLVIKGAPGCLFTLSIHNNKGSTQYIQLHDSATLPADAAVPVLVINMATVTNNLLDFGAFGKTFTNGIVVCNSSTLATKTIGSADCFFSATFS